ncbi:MAG: glycosyltransferase [Lachnospiraceae bacterium]|jgi:glycosyltransferase involved in cell wall biosynthesis|nr:glycosyltransferase [Lachnospiraceae bacterium]
MKLLTVAIPCYNSAEYMGHAIESLLPGGDEVEIIIVDDGSAKDNTLEIAKEYEAKYPGIIRAIHQENGGHGEAVNTGLKNATGVYYKVLDSDDWADKTALKKVLGVLREVVENGKELDMLIANYVYENVEMHKQTPINYRSCMPRNKFFTWDDIGHFKPSQNILMHSVFYRTELLRECGLKLPAHTFYVDNIFVYEPLPFVKTMYYLDVDFYRYFIGRSDQSVNEKVMISRVDQQIRVTKQMIDAEDFTKIPYKKLSSYMAGYLAMMMTVSSVLLIKSGTEENLKKKEELWKYLKKEKPDMYHVVRRKLLGRCMNLKGKLGRRIIIDGYTICRKIFGFS